jgi:hypothetical protein
MNKKYVYMELDESEILWESALGFVSVHATPCEPVVWTCKVISCAFKYTSQNSLVRMKTEVRHSARVGNKPFNAIRARLLLCLAKCFVPFGS